MGSKCLYKIHLAVSPVRFLPSVFPSLYLCLLEITEISMQLLLRSSFLHRSRSGIGPHRYSRQCILLFLTLHLVVINVSMQ